MTAPSLPPITKVQRTLVASVVKSHVTQFWPLEAYYAAARLNKEGLFWPVTVLYIILFIYIMLLHYQVVIYQY